MNDAAIAPSPQMSLLREMTTSVAAMAPAADDAERIDRIRQFEILKSAVAAAQLGEAVEFDTSQRVAQATSGVVPQQQGRGVAGQLGLATRQSPWHARRWLGWGKVLTRELPVTFAQLRAGATTEKRALLVAQETVWLSREDRAEVDAVLGPQLSELGDRRVENEARAHAQRLDPAGAAERRRVAERERRVTLRPRPDTMSSLTATTTVERGVEMWAHLRRDADALVGTGRAGGRTRDQVMADLHYERITGRTAATGPGVDVAVVVATDTLLGTDAGAGNEPAVITADGVTPIALPAPTARQLIADAPQASIRRLFVAPDRSRLLAMESRRRIFPDGLRQFIRLRDGYCSTPYCGAPIRHIDHGKPAEAGGPTSERNGNGRCAACNLAKQAPGWRQVMAGHGRGTITTPTGHRYVLRPPRLPGAASIADRSPLVEYFWQVVDAA